MRVCGVGVEWVWSGCECVEWVCESVEWVCECGGGYDGQVDGRMGSSFLDFTATYLCNVALTMTYAATVQMLRNFNVVLTAVLTLVMIRRALKVHEWIGVFGITGAMVLAAIPAFNEPDPSVSGNKSAIGIILALAGTSVQGVQLLTEEFFFRKGRYSPLKAIGCEGAAGIIYSFIAWPIIQATGFEDVTGSWYQQVPPPTHTCK